MREGEGLVAVLKLGSSAVQSLRGRKGIKIFFGGKFGSLERSEFQEIA